MDDLINIGVGDVLRLDHRIDTPLEINVGGVTKFEAVLLDHGGRKAVSISKSKARAV